MLNDFIVIFFTHIIRKSVRNCPNTPNELGKKFGIVRILRMSSEKKLELSEYSESTSICVKKIWKFIKILFFHEIFFFLIRKSPNTPNSIFRANIQNLLLREDWKGEKYYDLGKKFGIRNKGRKLPPLFGKYCQIRKLFQASSEKISALLNSELRIFFQRSFGVFGQFRIFFRGQFGVFGQFRIFFRAHSEYSDNSELISELYAEIIWKFKC
jgi:hypothetical protein